MSWVRTCTAAPGVFIISEQGSSDCIATVRGEGPANLMVRAEKMDAALKRIAVGEVSGDPSEPQSLYMNARKIASEALKPFGEERSA